MDILEHNTQDKLEEGRFELSKKEKFLEFIGVSMGFLLLLASFLKVVFF